METTAKQHIYFVDDEIPVLKAVKRTLEQLKVNVSCFNSGQDCLDRLEDEPCDLLISDIKMPTMGGLELLTKVKSAMPWVPVLIVTGFGDVPTAVKAVKMGAADFIEKPLDREGFLTRVQSLLDYSERWTQLIGKPLTKTELKVLSYILDGKSSKEIASCVHRSLRTVELHRQHVMRKLGVDNIVELVKAATDMGLLSPQVASDTTA